MHAAIWIVTLFGLVLWTLLAWGLHMVLTIDPKWVEDVEALIHQVPYAETIEAWFPGWREMLGVAMDLAQFALGWVGSNAPLVAWIVWAIGALGMMALGSVLSLIVCLLSEKPSTTPPRMA
jgi:hypothetical protein